MIIFIHQQVVDKLNKNTTD